MSRILVTGGAGYIGSHTVLALDRAGYEVTVFDNLSTGNANMVLAPAELVVGDLGHMDALRRVLARGFDGIIHFAASIVVPESVERPMKYYDNNVINTTRLIREARRAGVGAFIFSSSAAVYGFPDIPVITEDYPANPINPYGRSKLISEWVAQDVSFANPEFKHVLLRYFNVAGADPKGRLGQAGPESTHLIRVACETATGKRPEMKIFGTDYDTGDGTCVRDYIHVSDLAEAHVAALKHIEAGGDSGVYNCGYGHGFSVRQIVDMVREVSGVDFKADNAPRRAGDPGQLVADCTRLMQTFDWKAKHDDIRFIIETALNWEKVKEKVLS